MDEIRLAAVYMIGCLRAAGVAVPFPEVVTLDRAVVVARHVHRLLPRIRGASFSVV